MGAFAFNGRALDKTSAWGLRKSPMHLIQTKKYLVLIWCWLLLLAGPGIALAHPHVFADTSLNIVFDEDGLSGIEVEWVFDEFFSSMILEEFDTDHNNEINSKENRGLEKGAFRNLKNYNYFNWMAIDGKKFTIKWVKDFKAHVKGGRLVYSFFIPCHVKASQKDKIVVISPSDPTYYTALEFAAENPVSIKGGKNFSVKYKIAPSTERTIYYGMVHPLELTLCFKLKK